MKVSELQTVLNGLHPDMTIVVSGPYSDTYSEQIAVSFIMVEPIPVNGQIVGVYHPNTGNVEKMKPVVYIKNKF